MDDAQILADISRPQQQLCHVVAAMDVAIIGHTFLARRTARMDQESNDQKLQRAIGLHNEGKLDAAEALYRELLRDLPGH